MQQSREIVILGAGGHAVVVASILTALDHRVTAYFDDDQQRWGQKLLGIPVLGPISQAVSSGVRHAIIAIGDNRVRKRIAEEMDFEWVTAVHPFSWIHPEVPLGPGIEQPLVLWIPSIAPTGLTFYTADRIPAWKGNLFVGSARRGEVPRTGGLERVVVNDKLEELRRESLLTELHQRIRDVRQGPDGLLYVITDEDDGALLRIEPAP